MSADALPIAARAGRVEEVRALLAAGGVNPAAKQSIALRLAASYQRMDILRMLLEDGRADPSALHSVVLRYAAGLGHVEIVRLLLADGRADPAVDTSVVLADVCLYETNADVLQTLLSDGRADPSVVARSLCDPAAWPQICGAVRWRRRRRWLVMCAAVVAFIS
jgi:ankyrin repeat protein